ncbi:MAG: flagellar filament capping protein FliD [Planctomycetota bacterium]
MSSAGINFGGLASGLDTQAIISALMAVERRPIAALETKKTALNKQKTLFGDFKKLLEDLESKARTLRQTGDFLQMQAASSDEDILTVRASSAATPGTHSVVVERLASSQVNISNGRATKDSPDFGDGTMFLTIDGTVHGIDIGAGTGFDGTLEGIAQAINAQDLDVRADVVDTGTTGADRYKLVLRSSVVGADGAFSLTLDSGNTELGALLDELATPDVAAQNALVHINGVSVERSSNSIADLIPGVTLDLKSADLAKTVQITVSTDAEETSSKVNDFVEAYNKVVDFVSAQNQLGEDGEARNPLFGDLTLRSIRSSLRSIVGGSIATGNESISLLVQAGITSDREGKLTFNRSQFEEKLVEDERAVAALFSGSGIATRITDQIDVYTGSTEGLIKTRQDGFDRLIKDAQRRIDQSEDRLERFQTSLEQRFANLESLLARLQGQGSALNGFPRLG